MSLKYVSCDFFRKRYCVVWYEEKRGLTPKITAISVETSEIFVVLLKFDSLIMTSLIVFFVCIHPWYYRGSHMDWKTWKNGETF